MAINLDYPPGATPLDPDEIAGLIPGHIATQGELNEWEQQNIQHGDDWARKQHKEILNEAFVRQLHKQMFGETWRWAGEFRKSDKNIGVHWLQIGVELKKLLDDAHYQIERATYPPEELAVLVVRRADRPSVGRGAHCRWKRGE